MLKGWPTILPQGDRRERGTGQRQFHLKDLVYLVTAAAVILGLCRYLGAGPWEMLAVVVLWVVVWWQYAEIRIFPARPRSDQEPLREEVRRWKGGRDAS